MILLTLLGSTTPASARPAAQEGPALAPAAGPPGIQVLVRGLDPTVPWDGAYWDSGEEGGGRPLALRQVAEGPAALVAFEVPTDAAPREYRVLLASSRIQCIRAPCGVMLTFTVTRT